MKVIGLTRVHYGADYLDVVLRSAASFVNKHIVLYTPAPTFGFRTSMTCPDTRDQLYEIARNAIGASLDWREGLPVEVETAFSLEPDADVVLELDADEVIHPTLMASILDSYGRGELTARRYRLPFMHHWRSFDYGCTDGSWPVRLYLPKHADTAEPEYFHVKTGRYIHHFGYARSVADTQYKAEISAHRGEFRAEWWQDIFLNFPQRLTDLHPVSRDFWNAGRIARHVLPPVLWQHPYADREVIA